MYFIITYKQNDVNNYYTPTWNDLYQIIGVHKRQHFKIQNLQKANLYLKSKLKELESPDIFAQDQGQPEGDYQLVPVGPVEVLNKLEELQRRQSFYQVNNSVFRQDNASWPSNEVYYDDEPYFGQPNSQAKRYQGFRSRSVYYTIDDEYGYDGLEDPTYYNNSKYRHNYAQLKNVYPTSLLNEDRDLRPATFIKDIREKSQLIEEEKANYRRAPKAPVTSPTSMPPYENHYPTYARKPVKKYFSSHQNS